MDGAVVENIVGLARKPMQIDGFLLRPDDWLVDDPASLIKPGPMAKTFAVSTLGAVRDYLAANRDQLLLDHLVVHIAGAGTVHVFGPLEVRAMTRQLYLTASAADLTDGFLGKYMSLEDFLVGMQIRFADADDRKRVLSLLSNVKHETVKSALDDGVTQVVQARAGVALIRRPARRRPARAPEVTT